MILIPTKNLKSQQLKFIKILLLRNLIFLLDNNGKAGIYQRSHIDSDNIYIGSASNLRTRLYQYYYISNLGRNKTMFIYNALQLHRYSAFSLTILEACNSRGQTVYRYNKLIKKKRVKKKLILGKEQFYIDTLPPKYNILKKLGFTWVYSFRGAIYSEELSLKLVKLCLMKIILYLVKLILL